MRFVLAVLASVLIASVVQAQTDESRGEAMADHSSGHGSHAAPTTSEGAWSYRSRNNPKPYSTGRVEVVPRDDQLQYVDADRLSQQERCAALLATKHMAVDRATRAACTGAKPVSPPATHDPHAGHNH